MKSEQLKLINIGPIKEIELDLKPCMVFIGAQSTGKSVVSKLVTIFRSIEFLISSGNNFTELLENQNIKKFITAKSEVHYVSDNYTFILKDGKSKFNSSFNAKEYLGYLSSASTGEISRKFEEYKGLVEETSKLIEKAESTDDEEEKETLISKVRELATKSNELSEGFLNPEFKRGNRLTEQFETLSNYSVYIPAERALIPLLSQSSLTLINNKVELDVIPKYILSFGEYFESASKEIEKFDIDFLDISYSKNGNQKRILTKNKNPILLSESSSGIQSLLPAMLVIENTYDLKNKGQTFIVEEPELNLYPTAQKDFIYHLVNRCTRKNENYYNELIVTTHSPYVLSAFNNLLLASQAGEKDSAKTNNVISEENWLSPSDFGAYFLEDGKAVSIVNDLTSMIDEEELDSASMEIMNEFNQLFEIQKNV